MATVGGSALIGDKALQRKLERLEDGVRGRALRRALEEGMKPIVDTARSRAPRSAGPPTRGGQHLADSIDDEVTDVSAHHAEGAISYGKKQFHGTILELGGKGVPARPFLRPAWDQRKDDAQAEVAAEVRRLIRRLV